MADGFPHLQLDTDFLDGEECTAFVSITGEDEDAWRLVQLWLWLARHRPYGDINGMSPEMLAKKAGWGGPPAEFVDALEQAGLLVDEVAFDTEMRRFRGWGKRYDAMLRKRIRDREKARGRRKAGDGEATEERRRRDVAATEERHEGDEEATLGARGEERRGEESTGEDPEPERLSPEPEVSRPTVADVEAGAFDGRPKAEHKRDKGLKLTIVEAWALSLGKNPNTVKLTGKRSKDLNQAYDDGYQPSDIIDAVRAIKLSRHHMGQNDTNTVYDDLSYAIRDSKGRTVVERFRDAYRKHKGTPTRTGPPKDAPPAEAGRVPSWVAKDREKELSDGRRSDDAGA